MKAAGIGVSVDQGGSPPSGAAAPDSMVIQNNRFIMQEGLPFLEEKMVAIGGAHWALTDRERTLWINLCIMAYPELDLGALYKLFFWIVTVGIILPRLYTSVTLVLENMEEDKPDAGTDARNPEGQERGGSRKEGMGEVPAVQAAIAVPA
jgi:hypothetical protein